MIRAEAAYAACDASAVGIAAEAVGICSRAGKAHFEARAHGLRALALLRRDGAAARNANERDFAEMAALIERTGATTNAPFLAEWRAELAGVLGDAGTRAQLLREAEQGFAAIGAPKQVERLRALLAGGA
jgi:hypothetical protein